MDKKYFLDGDSLMVVEGEMIRRLVVLVPEISNKEVATPPVIEKPAVAENRTKTSAMLELLNKGLKPREVADALSGEFPNIAVSHVYSAMHNAKAKAKKEKGKKDTNFEDDIDERMKGEQAIVPLSDASEGWLVSEIRRLWVNEEMASVKVCQELKISLNQFNRLIIKYKISRIQI